MSRNTAKYLYNYITTVRFSQPVSGHYIMLRCQPAINECQNIEREHLILPPAYRLNRQIDHWGNRIVYGGTRDEHNALAYVSTGIVTCGRYAIRDTPAAHLYSHPTHLTLWSDEMEELLPQHCASAEEKVLDICHNIHAAISYTPASTDMTTTAAQAMLQRKGVCQDMAHLMIAVCRKEGITARYANGIICGTGETHAWVEYYDKCVWKPIDPAHDTAPELGHIKLAHGRDAADCPVSRGTFLGTAAQQTDICINVIEI